MLGTVLAVGRDSQSVFYVADEAPDFPGENRVFVSRGTTLDRQHVVGSGGSGRSPDADYSFSFGEPSADPTNTRALVIQVRAGMVTGMALGPGNSRSFLGAVDAGQVPLTVVGDTAIAGFDVQNLPGIVEYVADISNGDAIVVTAPMDDWEYSGFQLFRLFYGTPGHMVERPIVSWAMALSGGGAISFSVGSTTFSWNLTVVYGGDAGPLGAPGPGSLDTGAGMLPVTLRIPTPTMLSGFSFTCSLSEGG
jgi:hypothetical protein